MQTIPSIVHCTNERYEKFYVSSDVPYHGRVVPVTQSSMTGERFHHRGKCQNHCAQLQQRLCHPTRQIANGYELCKFVVTVPICRRADGESGYPECDTKVCELLERCNPSSVDGSDVCKVWAAHRQAAGLIGSLFRVLLQK